MKKSLNYNEKYDRVLNFILQEMQIKENKTR